jgi:hypothetical protein
MGRRHPINAMRTSKVPAATEKVGKVGGSAGRATMPWSSVATTPAPCALVPGRAFPTPTPAPYERGPQSRARVSHAIHFANNTGGAVLCSLNVGSRTSLGFAHLVHAIVPRTRPDVGCVAFLYSPERNLLLNPYQPSCAHVRVQPLADSSTFQGNAPCPM